MIDANRQSYVRSARVLALGFGFLAAGCHQGANKAAAPTVAVAAGEPAMAASTDPLILRAHALFAPIPAKPPELPGNPATPEKIALGAMLVFDPRLSATHSIGCASCHNIGLGGADNWRTSSGFHGTRGGRNSPTVFNAVLNFAQLWDGRAKDLEEHAGGPMVNPVEMASPK